MCNSVTHNVMENCGCETSSQLCRQLPLDLGIKPDGSKVTHTLTTITDYTVDIDLRRSFIIYSENLHVILGNHPYLTLHAWRQIDAKILTPSCLTVNCTTMGNTVRPTEVIIFGLPDLDSISLGLLKFTFTTKLLMTLCAFLKAPSSV